LELFSASYTTAVFAANLFVYAATSIMFQFPHATSGGSVSNKSFSLIIGVLALATFSPAQTKISGTMHCGRPDTDQQLDVGDSPGHTITLDQTTCTWTKPLVIAGIQDTEGISTQISETQSGTFTSHGYFVDTMANGDKIFLRYEATVTLDDGEVQNIQGKWTYTGGTGKFKGIQGDGTFSGGGRGASYDLQGEYTLPQ
jgi:hypothetical protein